MNPEAMHPGTIGTAIVSLALVLFVFAALGTLILVLRHRARNPLPMPGTLPEALGEDVAGHEGEQDERGPEDPPSSWERPADWWKP
ncbi:MAG: hypothetical protein AAF191_15265 [Verrucomicrobiota bacterium]